MLSFCNTRRQLRSFAPLVDSIRSRAPHENSRYALKRSFSVQPLCDGFLDLALALPIPPSFPPYSTTIILVTLVTRFALLPISMWGKRRMQRLEEIVIPQIEQLKPIVSRKVFEEMKKSGIRGDKDFLKKYHAKTAVEVLTARRQALFKEHKCRPMPSIIIPPLSQLPVFVAFTYVLGRLSTGSTPFDSESFLTLTTLMHPDPTMTMPILLGLITMANVESNTWLLNSTEREQLRRKDELIAKKETESGQRILQPAKIIKTSLRGLSVVRIVIASLVPGSVTLYWITSATFGLLQTWIIDWRDIRRKRAIKKQSLTTSASTSEKTPVRS